MPGWKTLAAPLLALALLSAGAGAMQAQFSGPALTINPQANQVQSPTTDPAILNPQVEDRQIAQGDLLTVKIFGTNDFAPSFRVSVDGSIQLPLIGVMRVAGMTVTQAEDAIARRLIDAGMYKDPQVTVQVSEAASQFATVSGELHAVVPMAGSRRLFEVLAAAGPLPVNASHVITILRPGQANPIVVDLGTDPAQSARSNIEILPRDTILISRVGVVYLLGAFQKQGAIPLDQNSPLTLLQATSLSGGLGYEGRYEDLRIVRTEGLERKMVKVDIKRIEQGKDPDPVLQANDIVFLPSNLLKAAIKSGGIATISSLLSLLVIALQAKGG
jgi:polysaccharide export outer membrane protein